jgi:hypothetical protein
VASHSKVNPLPEVGACPRNDTIRGSDCGLHLSDGYCSKGSKKENDPTKQQAYLQQILIDGALHALNEQDPIESFVKFLRYNAPELLKRILKEMQ